MNGTAAHIDYLGLTPGLVGVGQINFDIPAGTPSGNTIPVALMISGPAGATSATFTVSGGTVSSNQTVTIRASYGGSSAQASLTVTPPAAATGQLNVTNPFSFSAGLVVGAPPPALTTYTLTNSGTAALSYNATADVPLAFFFTVAWNPGAQRKCSGHDQHECLASSLAVGSYSATVSSGTTSIMRGGALSIVNPRPPAARLHRPDRINSG